MSEYRPAINITEDAAEAIERFTRVRLEAEQHGSITLSAREEARSYAVEALTALLCANPDEWRYTTAINRIIDARKGRSAV